MVVMVSGIACLCCLRLWWWLGVHRPVREFNFSVIYSGDGECDSLLVCGFYVYGDGLSYVVLSKKRSYFLVMMVSGITSCHVTSELQ